ncbi:MAG TPA: hypothetical protein ENN09_04760 [Planctomycetes bacterium]|nr:hypothetical protein [Planctomycetota bacterium]
MTSKVFCCIALAAMAASGCGGGSGSAGSAGVSGGSEKPSSRKGFGAAVVAEEAREKTEAQAAEADADADLGVLIVFEKKTAVRKGPSGPSPDTLWIEGVVEEVSADLSHIIVKRTSISGPGAKIGDPVRVVYRWPVDTSAALPDAVRETAIAHGYVKEVRGDTCVVQIDDRHSTAKIPKGSPAIIRWY